jgi:AraC-like DNA-binding protein
VFSVHILDALRQYQVVPFTRLAVYGKRKLPFQPKERRLLDYQLLYFQEGGGVMHVDGVAHNVQQHQFVLIQPGQLHNFYASADLVFPLLHFDIFYNPLREQGFFVPHGIVDLTPYPGLIQPRLNDFEGIHVPVIVEPQMTSVFKETMLKAIGLWQTSDAYSLLEANNLVAELVLALLKQYSTTPVQGHRRTTSLEWITSYLVLHLSEPIRVADMARRADLSASRFSALFTEQFRMGPHQYLLHLRIQHAQQLLRNPALTLAEIAETCGFSDMHHLSKTFKRMTGTTPREFRAGQLV